jgi:hypothetical protein
VINGRPAGGAFSQSVLAENEATIDFRSVVAS